MTQFWTDTVKRLTPYIPGEQRSGKNIVKLNTNENPYPPSPHVMQAVHDVSADALRRYPDPESVRLREVLASYHGLQPENVFVGNGSDEILALAFLAFFSSDKLLQYPDITYSFYPVYCELYAIGTRQVSLEDDYALSLKKFAPNLGGIIFPNPNAPTALATCSSAIEALLHNHTEHVLLVDEAYADFGAQSVIPLVKKHTNLLVSQTFSKGRSLAGMRLGVAFGDVGLIDALQRVKNSFNSYPVDAIAQVAGIASIEDDAYYKQSVSQIITTRNWTTAQLQQRGFHVLDSAANFLFVQVPERAGQTATSTAAHELFKRLSAAGVLVRFWNKPRLDQWLRISIGTDADMQKLMACVDG